jgi:DNA-binding response OmpR family regulator
MSVLLLEDNEILSAEMQEFLESKNYTVTSAHSISEFRHSFNVKQHHIVLIDLGLPDGDGVDLIREIRAQKEDTGVVIVTGRDGLSQKLSGFSCGADYYLTKPIQLPELDSVIQAMMRRLDVERTIQSRWVLDEETWQLTSPSYGQKGLSITLSAQDFIVIRTLISHRGKPVSRRMIIDSMGKDYLEYDQRRMDTQIRRLRRKVADEAGMELPLKTVHSVGYIFTADAEIIHSDI